MGKKIVLKTKNVMRIWGAWPWRSVPLSTQVDLGLLLFGLKPAMRFFFKRGYDLCFPEVLSEFFYYLQTPDSYYISWTDNCALLRDVDLSNIDHTYQFGRLLGYPACCCAYMEGETEENIDMAEQKFLSKSQFISPDSMLLNLRFYDKGIALISHVPCNENCLASINLAKNFIKRLDRAKNSKNSIPAFNKWVDRLLNTLGVKKCILA